MRPLPAGAGVVVGFQGPHRALIAVQHVFFGEEPQTVVKSHFFRAFLRGREVRSELSRSTLEKLWLSPSTRQRRPGGTHLSQRDGQIPERVEDGGSEAAEGAGHAAFQLSHKQI